MGPKQPIVQSQELFRQPLIYMINSNHPLVKLANVIDWEAIERSFGVHFQATTGRPALSPWLVAGLVLIYYCQSFQCLPVGTCIIDKVIAPNTVFASGQTGTRL